MNEKRQSKMQQNKSDAGRADRDDLLVQLRDLKNQATSLQRMDLVAEIERREKSLKVNNLTKQAYRSALDFIKNIKAKINSLKRLDELLKKLDMQRNTALSIFRGDLVVKIEQEKQDLITGDFTEEKYLVAVAFINAISSTITKGNQRQSR